MRLVKHWSQCWSSAFLYLDVALHNRLAGSGRPVVNRSLVVKGTLVVHTIMRARMHAHAHTAQTINNSHKHTSAPSTHLQTCVLTYYSRDTHARHLHARHQVRPCNIHSHIASSTRTGGQTVPEGLARHNFPCADYFNKDYSGVQTKSGSTAASGRGV